MQDGLWRNKAFLQQTIKKQVRNSLGILDIRFFPQNHLDMSSLTNKAFCPMGKLRKYRIDHFP